MSDHQIIQTLKNKISSLTNELQDTQKLLAEVETIVLFPGISNVDIQDNRIIVDLVIDNYNKQYVEELLTSYPNIRFRTLFMNIISFCKYENIKDLIVHMLNEYIQGELSCINVIHNKDHGHVITDNIDDVFTIYNPGDNVLWLNELIVKKHNHFTTETFIDFTTCYNKSELVDECRVQNFTMSEVHCSPMLYKSKIYNDIVLICQVEDDTMDIKVPKNYSEKKAYSSKLGQCAYTMSSDIKTTYTKIGQMSDETFKRLTANMVE
jgi:hypothetical protein